ncbi:DUF1016 N-terminal domain-containing protein [Elusimicrobiota bacterium]
MKAPKVPAKLLGDIRTLIETARHGVAQAVNSGLVMLYWQIGTRIRRDILKKKRADYGKRIVHTLSAQLTAEFGAGFSRPNLLNMLKFSEVFSDQRIVYTLGRQLGWSHFRHIIYINDPLKREFYAEMARVERWSRRTLEKKIQGMLYERTALSKKPAKLARQQLAAREIRTRAPPG